MIFKSEINVNQRDYMSINAYYLKKYIGIKEIILVLFLFVAGIVLGATIGNYFILGMCGITLILMIAAVIFYFLSAIAGFRVEFKKREVHKIDVVFNEFGIEITTHEKGGTQNYTEKRFYGDLEKIAILKDRIYLYFGAALMYNIRFGTLTEGSFDELCAFLHEKVDADKFKMKSKPKRK